MSNLCPTVSGCPETTKKPRAAAQVWAKFYQLDRGQTFFIGKTRYAKVGIFTARIVTTGDNRHLSPLRRVRTEQLKHVIKTKPLKVIPSLDESINSKPFVHPPPSFGGEYRGPVEQPNSDNAITGPTS